MFTKLTAVGVTLLFVTFSIYGCGDKTENPLSSKGDPYIQLVRSGNFNSYPPPNKTIGVVFDRYLGQAKWESIVAVDGQRYVNVRGGMTFGGKPITALIQFLIHPGAQTFEVNAVEFNGIPQNTLTINALIVDMYDEVG